MSKKRFKYWGLILILVIVLAVGSVLGFIIVKYFSYGTLSFGQKSIAIVEVEGGIYSSQKVIRQLKTFKKDTSVGGIIIDINSPGGAVVPTNEIYEKIKEIKEERDIPVYCSMGDIAASGGYYIATVCDKIYANGGTLTGSISVIMTFPNVEELFKKIGLKMVVVKTGEYKDIGSMFREMTPEEIALLEGVINDMYDQFVEVIYEGRKDVIGKKIDSEKKDEIINYILNYADGRIFTGRQAKDYGFVDNIGTIEDCVDDLAKDIGIEGKPTVKKIPEKKSIFDYLFTEKFEEIIPRQSPTIEYRFR